MFVSFIFRKSGSYSISSSSPAIFREAVEVQFLKVNYHEPALIAARYFLVFHNMMASTNPQNFPDMALKNLYKLLAGEGLHIAISSTLPSGFGSSMSTERQPSTAS
jgi:hypothetical protein